MSELEAIGINTLYILALINPISKVSILASLSLEREDKRVRSLVAKSSVVATGILFGTMIVGDFLLRSVFRVDLYSLQLAGGIVVFLMGLNALRHGRFFEHKPETAIEDVALVPLACPMIAGPATIAACISLSVHQGMAIAGVSVLLALGINHIIMMFSRELGRLLDRFNILGAIIRITGLIVMTIGTQMALDGISAWIASGKLL